MNKLRYVVIILLIVVILDSRVALSLSVETHEALNEKISKGNFNSFSLDNYLKGNIGLVDGVDEIIINGGVKKTASEWIQIGGKYEDDPGGPTIPYWRSKNHFHNPLKPLDQAGFTGLWDLNLFLTGQSAVLWSQSAPSTQSPGGYYAWSDVRNYFYSALTSTDQLTRNTNFADTFRGLGQLMHLVQDMSVPEHTRNEGHFIRARGEKT